MTSGLTDDIRRLKEECQAKEDALNELAFQIRELDRKIESLDKSGERERYEMSGEKVVKQKTGVESVMRNFFKRSSQANAEAAMLGGCHDRVEGRGSDQPMIRPVRYEEIEFLCKELVILLINQGISLDNATEVFWNRRTPDGLISCKDIQELMEGWPFMRDETDARLVARYCVEEGATERVRLDPELTVEFERFRSILRHLLGSFELVSAEELDKRYLRIQELLRKKQRNILEAFPKILGVKRDHCTLAELQANFKYNEVQISKEDYNTLLIKLWKHSNNIKEIHFKRIFEERTIG